MEYLLNLNEFDSEGTIDRIIKRIMDTGYISASMSKELDEVTGISNITKKLYKKVNGINDFYKESNSDFFDDSLLEFFEGSPYNYTVQTGVYLPDRLRRNYYLGHLRFDRNKKETLIPDEYESSSNKESLIFCFLMNFVKSINVASYKTTNEYEKEIRQNPNFIDRWNKFPHQRNINYTNYFNYFLDIQPCIYVRIKHKFLEQAWYMTGHQQLYLEGWTPKEYNDYTEDKASLSERIKKRLSYFSNLGKIESVSSDGGDTWTCDSYWTSQEDQEVKVKNPNKVLLRSNLTIKFDNN